MKQIFLSLLLTFGIAPYGWSQNQPMEVDSTESIKDDFFAVYPLLFYFPETRLGFGGAAIYNYYPGDEKSSRPSQWQLGGAYTLNKQILIYGSYQYFLRENRTELFGEVGYYDYFYFYYGTGNATRIADEETYFVRFPRLRINYLEQVVPNLRLGVSYGFDYYDIYDTQADGLLVTESTVGAAGGIISTAGLVGRYDTRNNVNLPTKGSLITANAAFNQKWLGSDFNFQRFTLDAAHYLPLGKSHVLAGQITGGTIQGTAPFQELLFLGGGKLGRGIIEGRFRSAHRWTSQLEYRFPLFWRFRGSVFTGLGAVSPQLSDLFAADPHLNYGGGLRFVLDPDEGIQFRFDVGLGGDEIRYYLTIGEAF